MWALVHVYFLIGVRHRLVVALNWAWSYVTFERGARLITGATEEGSELAAVDEPPTGRPSEAAAHDGASRPG
jgi:NADH dehydrogenase